MEDFVAWMRGRGIEEETINYLIVQKIDPSCIVIMDESRLEELFPRIGDRVMVVNFCQRHIAPKRQSLIDRLKHKIEEKNSSRCTSGTVHQSTSTKMHRKCTRMVELGWMHGVGSENFRYVRKIHGGGTRQVPFGRGAPVTVLKEKALELFFPDGLSPKGDLSGFTSIEMVDFKMNPLDETLTIDEYFDITKLSKLRFYLATRQDTYLKSTSEMNRSRSKSTRRTRHRMSANIETKIYDEQTIGTVIKQDPGNSGIVTRGETSKEDEEFDVFWESAISDFRDQQNSELSPMPIDYDDQKDTGVTTSEQLTRLVNEIFDSTEDKIADEPSNETADVTAYLSLEQSVGNLQQNIISSKTTRINVYREDVFGCCLRALRRKNFQPFHKIKVDFTDVDQKLEGAVDEGGPTREMFRLLLNSLADSPLFTREPMKHLSLNSASLRENHYFEAGRMIALSLLHGGPGPHFFSGTLYSLIVNDSDNTHFTISDLEPDIADKLLIFQQENDLFKLRDLILTDTIFAIAGCHFIGKLEDKDLIVEDIIKFYACHRIQEPLQQLISGLKSCAVLDEIRMYPDSYKPLFCMEKPSLSAEGIQNLFKFIEYSPTGSNKRQEENRTICFFKDYLQDCEDGESSATLQSVMIFATGADSIPPRGFTVTPKISFLHDNAMLPTVSTCSIELRLPTSHAKYQDFKEKIDFAIMNSNSFGTV